MVKTAFKFFLDGSEPQPIRDFESKIGFQGCVSFIKQDGNPAILLAGGSTNGMDALNTVIEYDILSNTYDYGKPKLPAPRRGPILVLLGNYFYAFGGIEAGVANSVYRLEKTITTPWEDTEKPMTFGGQIFNTAVIPYNY